MDTATIDDTTQQYLGQWQRLVSTTNWDKGRIISAWRQSLAESGAPAAESSDDAWSRRVGNVTAQHVGRLRRTWERFGGVRSEYDGLYWSHFQAATEWADAEMWLEGAAQSDWSVAQMRHERAVNLGLVDAAAEDAEQAGTDDWDDDAESAEAARGAMRETVVHDPDEARSQRSDEPDYEADDEASASGGDTWKEPKTGPHAAATAPAVESPQPFAALPSLPADVSDAFEAFKLCILRHKLAGWGELSQSDVLAVLDALKELALGAPSE
jgi:hypothetical protein